MFAPSGSSNPFQAASTPGLARQPATNNLFTPNAPASTAAPTGAPSLFGAPQAGASLFGAPQQPASTAAPSLFGAPPTTSMPATGGLFGATPAASGAGGLFGAASTPAPGAGAPGLFGAAPGASAAPPSLFGAAPLGTSAAPGAGLFGAPANPAAAGGGGLSLFGGAPGAPGGANLFGAAGGAYGGGFSGMPAASAAPLAPAGPSVTLDTPYAKLPAEHRQFLDQLDALIERTAQFNRDLLPTQGIDDGELRHVSGAARECSARVEHMRAELEADEATTRRFKAQVDEVVRDARLAEEAFERRAQLALGGADGGSALTYGFFERQLGSMRRQAEALDAQLVSVEQLVAAAEQPRAWAAEFGGADARGGTAELHQLMAQQQQLLESLAARVAETHAHTDRLRREHIARVGHDPFAKADSDAANISTKHKHAGIPRAHLVHWSNAQAPPSSSAGQQQPAASGPLQTTTAPSLFAPLGQPANTAPAASAALGARPFGAPAGPSASAGLPGASLFGSPATPAPSALGAAPSLAGGFSGGLGAGTAQFGLGATPGFGMASQPNLRTKKKSTTRR